VATSPRQLPDNRKAKAVANDMPVWVEKFALMYERNRSASAG
jgi:hypothetical protein